MLTILLCVLTSTAAAEDPWDKTGWGWGGVPAINYNSDSGVGFGAVGNIYRYNGEVAPYKTGIDLIVFATTQGVHNHKVAVDAVDVGGAPLRLEVQGKFMASRTWNYCGVGRDVTCDDSARLLPDEFLLVRFLSPSGFANFRYAVKPMPHKVEVIGGMRVNAIFPGDFEESGVYPGSLYAFDSAGGEAPVVSVLQTGVMWDNRDNEPAPATGYWIEGTIRGAAPYWGSQYTYFGFNSTVRNYLSIVDDGRLVLANRVMFDGLVGNASIFELATPGGSQDYVFFGGYEAGRGIRQARYLGRVKAMEQPELRGRLLSAELFGKVRFDLGALAFADVGWVSEDWSTIGESLEPIVGTGGGLRFAFDQNFIIRADVGVSPVEGWSPGFYLDLGNNF